MGHYMTKEERIIMQTLLDEKKPVSYIARKLGCCRQTVYNEIRRGQYLHDYGYYDKLRYSADKGQQIHDYNQTAKGRPLKIGSDHAFAAYIEHKIGTPRLLLWRRRGSTLLLQGYASAPCTATSTKRCFISWATGTYGRSGRSGPRKPRTRSSG